MGLIEIAKKMKGNCCEHLVKYNGQEVTISGVNAGIGEFKIGLGNFSNKIRDFNSIPEIMKALDNSQYLLCRQADMTNLKSFKETCLRIRLMHILAITQLQVMLSIPKPNRQLQLEIQAWIEKMNLLVDKSISLLEQENSATRDVAGSKCNKTIDLEYPLTLAEISEYEGIKQEEMEEAIKILMS